MTNIRYRIKGIYFDPKTKTWACPKKCVECSLDGIFCFDTASSSFMDVAVIFRLNIKKEEITYE